MHGTIHILVVAAICSILLRIQGFHSISICFLLALLYLLYRNKENYVLLVCSSITLVVFYANPIYFEDPPLQPSTQILDGQITSIPRYNGNKISFEIKTPRKQTFQVNYHAKTSEELDDLKTLKIGTYCSLNGIYKELSIPRNFYSFDYKEHLATRNIFFQFTPTSFEKTNCMELSQNPFRLLQRYRQKGIQYIKDNFPEASQGIMIALLFGDRHEMNDQVLQAYQSLGIVHLLAVSGLHVGLVSGTIYFLLLRIGFTKEKTIELLLILLPIYAILAGGAPSVVRASAMSMVVILCIRARMKLNPLDGISFVCLILLLINPSYLLHLGFQLSFLVSYTLLVSATTILQRYTSWILQLLAVTILAQIVSFPLIIYHFYEISFWSIPLNLIYIPFVTLFTLPFAFVTFVCHILFPQPISDIILVIYDFIIATAHNGLEKIMALPYSSFLFGQPPLYIVALYYVAIGGIFYSWEKFNSTTSLLKSSSLFIIVLLLHWHLPYLTSEGEVTMLDVGQGESILIELPRRKAVYLIDTGGIVQTGFKPEFMKREREFDVGRDVVVPYLKAKGVRKIDKLILSHGHYDHIGGAEALIDVISVETILYGIGSVEGIYEKQLLEKFREIGTKIIFVKQGDYWRTGNSEFFILSPFGKEQSLNNRSIVLYTEFGGLKWLFPGDLEVEGERRLLENYPQLDVDVLKVGHHGSFTSTTEDLLEQVNPKIALISLGKNNLYGHPHKDVIERLNERNIKVFRTDQNGAIRYKFKQGTGYFETMIKEKVR
ncbi:DNA internalization-related competence protein ComEC/Rec2 [Anaerobacillus alkaliphilus]|uniref:DNA internalization-related competence protein ComEC/Rec2 n=1 Tax=Anaerobacillus alkaliphilus TaxID=1548597 RepID=UPI001375A651|nr:DNA internalization-related competence protein ComEC/Rec2 [Anaerobacillus alkaliphilus]